MDVSSYRFSDEEIVRLQQYRDRQQDVRLKVRFMALLMLAKDIAISDVGLTPKPRLFSRQILDGRGSIFWELTILTLIDSFM
jgi:hypothetical protein